MFKLPYMKRFEFVEAKLEKIMATLAEVQASQAAEDADIKNLITAYQTTQASVTALQAQIAALQGAGGASATDLDALKADADATKAQIDAALAPATPAAPAPGP